jgi:RND family efflux transporter MFP subunit
VLVNVQEHDLGQMAVGEPVQLDVAAFPGRTFAATVESISPTLDAKSRTAAVHIHPQDPDAALRAGMFASVSIITANKHNTLLVPNAALRTDGNQAKVVAIDGTNAVRVQPVQLGLKNDTVTEIVSGLDQGDLVATSSLDNLHDGEVVAPRTDSLTAFAPGSN